MIGLSFFAAAKTVGVISQQRELYRGGMACPTPIRRKITGFFACRTSYRGTPLADF